MELTEKLVIDYLMSLVHLEDVNSDEHILTKNLKIKELKVVSTLHGTYADVYAKVDLPNTQYASYTIDFDVLAFIYHKIERSNRS